MREKLHSCSNFILTVSTKQPYNCNGIFCILIFLFGSSPEKKTSLANSANWLTGPLTLLHNSPLRCVLSR